MVGLMTQCCSELSFICLIGMVRIFDLKYDARKATRALFRPNIPDLG